MTEFEKYRDGRLRESSDIAAGFMEKEMQRYLVSFGSDYRHTPHPVLGYWPELGQDAVLEVYAPSYAEARDLTFALIGKEWCALYGPDNPPGWEPENLGLLADAVTDPKPGDWTVGVSVTVDHKGEMTLNLEDLSDELRGEGAAPSVIALLDERTEFYRPAVGWVKR